MKSTLLFLLLILSVPLLAGNWDMFPPHQKMYFYNEDANALDWFELNPTMLPYTFESDKYNNFLGAKGCPVDTNYFSLANFQKHKWHFDDLFSNSSETIYPVPSTPSLPSFQDQFVYLKNIMPGQYWTLTITDSSSTYKRINITYSSKSYESIYGVMDSVKTFTFDGVKWNPILGQGQVPISNFKLVVSKNFGVLEFVPLQQMIYNPRTVDFTSIKIIGVEKTGFSGGVIPPSLSDFVDYQIGQILNWENIKNNSYYQLFRDSITSMTYLSGGISYTFDRKITNISGNNISYVNNLIRTIDYNDLTAYLAPPEWGDFQNFDLFYKQMNRNESFVGIDKYLGDTIFRTSLTTTEWIMEKISCNNAIYTDVKEWEVFDNRYGLAEFGSEDLIDHIENRLVVPGPCPGIDSSQNCSNLPSNIDCDNGGLTNYQECLNGTDPFDPTDDFIIILPVELVSFKAVIEEVDDVNLEWITAIEYNTSVFEIERSFDNKDFEKIATVQAAGTSNQNIRYQSKDEGLSGGYVYYRLKMIDLDGSFTYSKVAVVNIIKTANQITLYPNPVKRGNMLQLTTDTEFRTEGLITIQDITGKEVLFQSLAPNKIDHTIHLTGLIPGVYLVKLTFDGKRVTKKLVIN